MNTKVTASQPHRPQRQTRGIWLTVLGCLVFITILVGLFFHKITTPRYLSTIELRINGLVLLKQPHSLLEMQAAAIARQLLPGKWHLLAIHTGRCDEVCVERITQAVSMLDQLNQTYREKTQLALIMDDAKELLAAINERGLEDIQLINSATPQLEAFDNAIDGANSRTGTDKSQPAVVIIDSSGYYRGYFTAPFDHNKMLLTYSSVVEHR